MIPGESSMAGGLLFVTQPMLDSWAEQGRIELAGDVMTLLRGEGSGRTYALEPAVRFLRVVGAEGDPNALVSKVKPVAQLRGLGAEQVADSVVLGDVAYDVEPGFLAEAAALQAVSGSELPAAPVRPWTPTEPRQPPPAVLRRRKEAEALARFLLDELS
jgi:hypothetical protein